MKFVQYSQVWTKSEPGLQTGQQIHVPSMVRRIPVRTVKAGGFILKTWVESLAKHNDNEEFFGTPE